MITFCEAAADDLRLLFEWRNESETRRSAFDSSVVTWERHCEWFNGKIGSLNSRIFILTDENSAPVGQVRFDINNDGSAEVDISIDVNHRGKNYATEGLMKTCSHLKKERKLNKIFAYVKKENAASYRCFQKAGFKNVKEVKIKSFECNLMVYS